MELKLCWVFFLFFYVIHLPLRHCGINACDQISLVFKDKCTPSPFVEEFPEDDGEAARAALPDHIYMDAMGFGMGNCCLQVVNELTEQRATSGCLCQLHIPNK